MRSREPGREVLQTSGWGGGRERVLGSVDTRATWEDGRDTWEVRGWGGARRQDSGIGCEGT